MTLPLRFRWIFDIVSEIILFKEDFAMNESLVGREKEVEILSKAFKSTEAQLIAVYGRRRIGKTHLIREFYSDKGLYIQFMGVQDSSSGEQFANFHDELGSIFTVWNSSKKPKSWREAFQRLVKSIKQLAEKQRVVLFFDEVPWLSNRSNFLKALEYSWNQHFVSMPGIVVVLCGSASSWMIKHVIQNKGGLHGRLTSKLHLQPFTLLQTEQFLESRGVRLARKQIVEVYMSVGGVAQYLKAIPPGKSPAQAIQEVCFSPQGLLFREFYPLYRSLFEHSEKYVAVVKALAKHRAGLAKQEILDKTALKSGGTSSRMLQELEESGIISYIPDLGKKKKGGKYRLIDEYSLFYLHWIENVTSSIITGIDIYHWQKQEQSHDWRVWAGYAFENICYRHLQQIKRALGLAAVNTRESMWYGMSENQEYAQIDLVIDRADQCINLCEMKCYSKGFKVDRKVAQEMQHKKKVFESAVHPQKTLFTTLITLDRVSESDYYQSAFDGQITLDELFT